MVHCQGGYRHDPREEVSTGREMRHYRFLQLPSTGTAKTTPPMSWAPLQTCWTSTAANRMLTLVSVASKAAGLHRISAAGKRPGLRRCKHEFCPGRRGDDHHQMRPGRDDLPDAGHYFAAGLFPRIPCCRGQRGMYMEDNKSVFLDGKDNEYDFKWERALEQRRGAP